MNGIEDFYRGWTDYVKGFGKPDEGEYWLGLDKIYRQGFNDNIIEYYSAVIATVCGLRSYQKHF